MKKDIEGTTERIETTLPLLNEYQRRIFLGAEAKTLGYGGISQVSKISGVSRVRARQQINFTS